MESTVSLFLSGQDVILGLLVSIAVGLIAGVWPASAGANLNPVDAIRSK
jgi:ABC-type antimicrobial peptide transport system permease subunit